MDLWIMGIIAGFLVSGFLYRRGRRHLREVEKLRQRIMDEHRNVEFLGRMAYQGGFPEMPKLIYLNVAVTGENLLLFDDLGKSGAIAISRWTKVEKFAVCQKADLRTKSVAVFGPMISLFAKDRTRYFVLIKYLDHHNIRNNILLEANSPTLQDNAYGKINTAFNRFRNFTNVNPSLVIG